MKTKHTHPVQILRLASILLPTVLCGCLSGSGRLETRPFALSGFDSVEVNRGVQVEIARDDAFAVSVTADDNVFGSLEVSQDGTTLRIRLPNDVLLSNVTVRAAVSMPALASVHASGAAHATFSGFDASAMPGLRLSGSGASEIDGVANTDALSLDLSGASHATLTGTAAAADVSMSGGSSGSLTVGGSLDYDLSGGSHLVYYGDPQIGRSHASGGSSAERG